MKFGYFCNTTNWTHKPYDKLLDETRDITQYCDQNKWDSIWYTEHHFNHEGMESLTNPLMMGADAAAGPSYRPTHSRRLVGRGDEGGGDAAARAADAG